MSPARGLPARGVLSPLFTLVGGGSLAQGEITAQGEAESWKPFAGAGLRLPPPATYTPVCGIKCPLILKLTL